ncbi:uncharacterized protein [Montipora capricornis]|uniref:uncharacterized protein isoform X3 n=1 Tax=Montipora capricornis TaxID=246305 RepID=UPI0035F1CB07
MGYSLRRPTAEKLTPMKHKDKMAEFVDVPQDLKGYVIGTRGNIVRSIMERSRAKVYSYGDEKGFWVKGTKEQREDAKKLILEMVEGGRVKLEQRKSTRICYYIDNLNLPANTKLRLQKERVVPSRVKAEYRLRPIHSYEIEVSSQESPSPRNDPSYLKDLEAEVLHSLERIKREMEAKPYLKADIWCHFGTVLIHQPDEGTGGEWIIENAVHKLLQGTKWKTVFKGGINLDEKFVEQHLCNQSRPEYDNYLSRYDLAFQTPNGSQVIFKAWVTKKNVAEKLEGIPIPYTDVKNILDEVDFHDPFTSSRCRGWLIFPRQRYLRADILFPGCEFDCRLLVRVLADSGLDMDLVPKEDTRNALLRYLSKVTFSDEDDFGLRVPDVKFIPDGFQLTFMRCSKRAQYRFSEEFSIILSKESIPMLAGDIVKKETDFHLHCKEWDELLISRNWEPAQISKKLPDFFQFVKKVQSSIIHEMKHEGASVPPEILARGSSAVESYFKALADGRTSLKRVPVMLIGQDRAGKTSLKKSLKGICFDPEEDSTVGIDVDPSYFKVTTETLRTGTVAKQQDADEDTSFDRHAAMKIVHDLKKENQSPMFKTSTEETRNPLEDKCEIARITDTIQSERHTRHSKTRQRVPKPKKDETDISPFSPVHNQEARTDFTGILPEEIAVETETLLKGDVDDNRKHVYLTLWDFAGQSVYYDTHPIFLTEQAIYCLVYDLSLNPHDMAKPVVKQGVYKTFQDSVNLKTNLDYLDFWMRSVASLAGGAPESADRTTAEDQTLSQELPPVILVCTHADTPYDKERNPTEIAHEILGCLKSKPYGIHLSDVFVVDNTKSGTESECPEVVSLRKEVYDVAKGLPHISETIPIKWLKFDKALRALKGKEKHVVSLEVAKDAAESCDIAGDVGFETVMNYLHDLRILIHFDDTPALNELVVLDIKWLIDVFKNIITVKPYDRKEQKFVDLWSKLEKEGVLHEELLSHVWGTLSEKEGLYEGLITIMEKFSLLCPLSSEKPKSYLVPSMLKTRPTSDIVKLVSSAQIPSLFVKFKPEKVPAGLFHRLVLQFFRWGKGNFLSANIPQLFQNVVRFITCGDKICSVIFVCYTSTVEVAIYSEDQQKATAYTCASVVCRQLGLKLESMRKEFFWLRNMRYEMAVLCPVCCRGGALEDYCDSHDLEGCKEEHCLHFWLLSELCSAKKPIVCNTPGLKKDVVVDVEQFSPWIPSLEQQNANGEPPVRSLSTGEESRERAIVLPCKLVESLSCQSSDWKQVLSQLQENLPCSEASLDNPDVGTRELIRRFTREAKYFGRLDVVRHLRGITPAGTTGPVLPENLQIQDMSSQQRTDVTVALTVADKWQLVAEKFGLNRDRIDFLNSRFPNPADALLAHIARQRPLTVGYVYDLLCECDLQVIADKL